MLNPPNVLSLFRIILIPIFSVIYLQGPAYHNEATLILVVSGVSDFLDGQIARRYNMVTDLGKLLDPLADKLTQMAVVLCISLRHHEFFVVLCLLVVKEVIMIGVGIQFLRKGVPIPGARWFGKIATAVFYFIVTFVVFRPTLSAAVLTVFVTILVVVACIAFFLYALQFIAMPNKKSSRTCKVKAQKTTTNVTET